ncbi:class I SAM-dependent methyltransferase [Halorhabdus sp. CBA1104]|uniref:class I SAM-dependent methyltransferase n=1 Tax=Halorhabdus sp. CBA1104 TaxID=1380432 RepID=UPI0012B28864|nr:class I SAM-dependent methyltransferase [Halorhabdus sp. CBA1104]QGN06087.1 class I SAM-dependent methyltransferase [Halorhabdus sp. CBA1104]
MDSNDVRRTWADRSGEFSPAYYAHYGPDEKSEAIGDLLAGTIAKDGSVLELGFGSGRHLSHLQQRGFESLSGVDVNEDALDVMTDAYPALAADGTFYFEAIEDVVEDFDDGAFEAVYSVETLQHVHPDADWVFAELRRITDALLVTIENESEVEAGQSGDPAVTYVNDEVPLYYRDWKQVFTDAGFVEIESRPLGRDILRVFRPDDHEALSESS